MVWWEELLVGWPAVALLAGLALALATPLLARRQRARARQVRAWRAMLDDDVDDAPYSGPITVPRQHRMPRPPSPRRPAASEGRLQQRRR